MARNLVLDTACSDILGQQMPVHSNIEIEFISNSVGGQFSFVPYEIDGLEFDYDYLGNVFTSILVDIKVSGYDYALLQDQSQNIIASLKITPVTTLGDRIRTVAPYLKQYRVMLVNAVDTRISAQDIHLHTEPTRNMVVRLIEPLAYRLRHESVTACLHSATVSDMIHFLVHSHEIQNVDIIAPDNTHAYDHMIVPSYPSFMSSVGYLHSHYGVYMNGCSYYIQDDRFYVYPPFDTNPNSNGTLTFYQGRLGQSSVGGSKYTKAGNDYRIIIDKGAPTTDLSMAGAENHGTGFSFTRASRLTDGTTYIDPYKDGSFTEANTLIFNRAAPQSLDPTSNKIKQVKSTDNPFVHMSVLAGHNASLMTCEWEGADINAASPGKKVVYNYDEGGVMASRTGILDQGKFVFQRQQRAGKKSMFTCHALLTLRLTPATRRVV